MIFELDIAPKTLEASPMVSSFDVGIPLIRKISVTIPDGHKFLARLAIFSYGQFVIPDARSGAEWIRGNGTTKEYIVTVRLEGPPYNITLKGWNEDDTYPHSFIVEVT